MKKFSAILLISIFAFSQYARQLNFLECKLLNTLKPATMKCDCEKLAGFEKKGEDNSSAPKTHLHIHLDEFFAKPSGILSSALLPGRIEKNLFPFFEEADGNYPLPWRPPNS